MCVGVAVYPGVAAVCVAVAAVCAGAEAVGEVGERGLAGEGEGSRERAACCAFTGLGRGFVGAGWEGGGACVSVLLTTTGGTAEAVLAAVAEVEAAARAATEVVEAIAAVGGSAVFVLACEVEEVGPLLLPGLRE